MMKKLYKYYRNHIYIFILHFHYLFFLMFLPILIIYQISAPLNYFYLIIHYVDLHIYYSHDMIIFLKHLYFYNKYFHIYIYIFILQNQILFYQFFLKQLNHYIIFQLMIPNVNLLIFVYYDIRS